MTEDYMNTMNMTTIRNNTSSPYNVTMPPGYYIYHSEY